MHFSFVSMTPPRYFAESVSEMGGVMNELGRFNGFDFVGYS